MTDTENPPNRIVAGLPAGTRVAHKTGTWGRAAMNDVGIITLPGGRGHLALAVFIRNLTVPDSVNARVIAAITRAVWERAAGRGAGAAAIGRSTPAARTHVDGLPRRAGPASR
jgi:beta-lactamase class A